VVTFIPQLVEAAFFDNFSYTTDSLVNLIIQVKQGQPWPLNKFLLKTAAVDHQPLKCIKPRRVELIFGGELDGGDNMDYYTEKILELEVAHCVQFGLKILGSGVEDLRHGKAVVKYWTVARADFYPEYHLEVMLR
jgi:hypothetical protein